MRGAYKCMRWRLRHPWRLFKPRPVARPTSFQQQKEVGKKCRSPANLLFQFKPQLTVQTGAESTSVCSPHLVQTSCLVI